MTATAQHTPGPWSPLKISTHVLNVVRMGSGFACLVVDDVGDAVARANGRTGRECEANARLIAVAPDLFDFAGSVSEIGEAQLEAMDLALARDTIRTMAALARAAIARAEGQEG